jgi:hypothetical protein
MNKSFSQLQEDSNRVGVEFFFTELAAARTFLDVAEATTRVETKQRSRDNAHVAYQSILHYRPRLVLEEQDCRS